MKPKELTHLLKYICNTIQKKWQQNWHLIWVNTHYQGVQSHERNNFPDFPDFFLIKFDHFAWFLDESFEQDTLVWFTISFYHIFDELDNGNFDLIETT